MEPLYYINFESKEKTSVTFNIVCFSASHCQKQNGNMLLKVPGVVIYSIQSCKDMAAWNIALYVPIGYGIC